jgi:RimJ/RimL family protein N-acetyltransferase
VRRFETGMNESRTPSVSDVRSMNGLMISADKGTIDYDGEDLDDASAELESYLDAFPLLSHSRFVIRDGTCAAGCLVSYVEREQSPLVAYVMTAAEYKRRGLSKLLLRQVLASLGEENWPCVHATITEGNIPSENLFAMHGFTRLDTGIGT